MALSQRFLVLSLGNPGPYYETLHSAGHLALNALQKQLEGSQPPFRSARHGSKACLSSIGHKYHLLQSPTMMNASGPWVASAWKQALADSGNMCRNLGLVLVHDDLEEHLGVVKLRKWDKSHRGHNGIKSVNGSLRQSDFEDSKWARISIGIGRPAGRDTLTVSNHVLRPLSKYQKSAIQDQAGPALLESLLRLEAQWM